MTLVLKTIASAGIAAIAIGQVLSLNSTQTSYRQEGKTLDRVLSINLAQSISKNGKVSVSLSADYFYQRGLANIKQEFYGAALLDSRYISLYAKSRSSV